jgi:hypothetical protein
MTIYKGNAMSSIARMFLDDSRARLAHARHRITGVINQLSDEDLNWRPNPQTNSVTNLIIHICGNLKQRYGHHITGEADLRDRPAEFDTALNRSRPELLALMDDAFGMVDGILERLPMAMLFNVTQVRGESRSILDIIITSTTHTSEHLGQIIYIAKIRLGPRYEYMLKL